LEIHFDFLSGFVPPKNCGMLVSVKRIPKEPEFLGRTAMFVQRHSHLVLPGIGAASKMQHKEY
jgi:hypothetical protein